MQQKTRSVRRVCLCHVPTLFLNSFQKRFSDCSQTVFKLRNLKLKPSSRWLLWLRAVLASPRYYWLQLLPHLIINYDTAIRLSLCSIVSDQTDHHSESMHSRISNNHMASKFYIYILHILFIITIKFLPIDPRA